MPLTVTRERSLTWVLAREPAQVGCARRQVRESLAGWGLGEHTDLAGLIVSELVTNALRHGGGPIQVRMDYVRGRLRIGVHDDGGLRPVRRRASADDEQGRGLELLDGLIAVHGGAWGVTEDSGGPGKTVHAVVLLAGAPVR